MVMMLTVMPPTVPMKKGPLCIVRRPRVTFVRMGTRYAMLLMVLVELVSFDGGYEAGNVHCGTHHCVERCA